jgi:hypothetical protein
VWKRGMRGNANGSMPVALLDSVDYAKDGSR